MNEEVNSIPSTDRQSISESYLKNILRNNTSNNTKMTYEDTHRANDSIDNLESYSGEEDVCDLDDITNEGCDENDSNFNDDGRLNDSSNSIEEVNTVRLTVHIASSFPIGKS